MASTKTMQLDTVCGFLSQIAPLKLAESWDNVGLLIGDRKSDIQKIMTCLTVTPDVVTEAIEQKVDLVVAHHPLPFQPLKRITSDNLSGKLILDLIAKRIAVYSAHTAYDSSINGINQQWCHLMGVESSRPLIELEEEGNVKKRKVSQQDNPAVEVIGSGRFGRLVQEEKLKDLANRAATAVHSHPPRIVGDPEQIIRKVGFACGSGGSFLSNAIRCGCDALITGEATFHICLEAESRGIGLILMGHYASERFAMDSMAEKLSQEFPNLRVWASQNESDPILGGLG